MPSRYAIRWVQDFAEQLLRGPKRLRLRQLFQIDFLLSLVEAGKSYPTDFIVHTLTGYRARAASLADGGSAAEMVPGDGLRLDLAQLAEDLSEDAALPVEAYDGTLFSVEELAERFHVSTKTIFRWRRRGLVGWKFRQADKRMRVLFADRCVRRFVAEHADLVHRGATFSQLTAGERQTIINRAAGLVQAGAKTTNSVAKTISEESGRAVETIRLILKAYDDAHPGAGIFNRDTAYVPADDQRLAIWSAYCEGAAIEALATRFGKSVRAIYSAVTQMRAMERARAPIEFVPSAEFEAAAADQVALHAPELDHPYRPQNGASARAPASLPPYLQQLFALPLLSAEGEAALFRKMNYLRFKAEGLRRSIDPETTTAAELDRIDALLAEAEAVKNQITNANLRLVVSIAKRHAKPTVDFFEIVSDGNISLMRAVEKFDYSRGFKFSTYASWAIIKNYARSVPEADHYHDRYQTGRDTYLESVPAATFDELEDDQQAALRGILEKMLDSLDERDREILRQRFGIDRSSEPQTLEQIGRHLGVSKERVRQLEARAMEKLRSEFGDEASLFVARS